MSQLPEVIRDIERVSADVVAKASTFQAAILADVAGRRGTMHARVAPVHQDMKVAGPAFTVEVRPGDNLMIHAAIALAKPGDVLVIDGKGDQTAALMGTLMLSACKKIGLAGVIVDGAIRDKLEILDLDFPVFSAGFNPPRAASAVREFDRTATFIPMRPPAARWWRARILRNSTCRR